jgi:hypothetical protein
MTCDKEDTPITFGDGFRLKWGLNSFYNLNLSIGKAVLSRGTLWLLSKCELSAHIFTSSSSYPTITAIEIVCNSCCYGQAGSATHNSRWAPRRYKYLFHWTSTSLFGSPTFRSTRTEQKISLSPLLPTPSPKLSFDFHHQNLREITTNFDWRLDPVIPKVWENLVHIWPASLSLLLLELCS